LKGFFIVAKSQSVAALLLGDLAPLRDYIVLKNNTEQYFHSNSNSKHSNTHLHKK